MTFETTTDLLPHQALATAKLLPARVGALFMEMGTGKSRTLIELAKLRRAKWDRLFWFCPVALRQTMLAQLLEHTNISREQIAVWGSSTGTDQHLIHIIGIESMSSSDRTVAAFASLVTPRSFVAVDESGYIKGYRSTRTRRITDLSMQARYRVIMTGTPLTQGAVDLYAQMRFLSPKILGYHSFHTFARNHLEYREARGPDGRKHRTNHIIRALDVDVLAAKISPYTYQVRKDECLTLPDKIHETRWCSMTTDQRRLYESVKRKILTELDYDDWSSIRIFHLFTALQTVVCGWHQDAATGLTECRHTRLDVLRSTAHEIPANEPVIIWAKYRRAVEQISATLATDYGDDQVHQFYGDQSDAARNRALDTWRTSGRFLVATQPAGGHGLTLNKAAYAIFYADGFKFSERLQAEDRNHRIGQTRRPVYITIRCAASIDDRIAAAIARKGSALDAFRTEMDTARSAGLKQRIVDMVMNT